MNQRTTPPTLMHMAASWVMRIEYYDYSSTCTLLHHPASLAIRFSSLQSVATVKRAGPAADHGWSIVRASVPSVAAYRATMPAVSCTLRNTIGGSICSPPNQVELMNRLMEGRANRRLGHYRAWEKPYSAR